MIVGIEISLVDESRNGRTFAEARRCDTKFFFQSKLLFPVVDRWSAGAKRIAAEAERKPGPWILIETEARWRTPQTSLHPWI